MYNTPILLITFNRPNHDRRVLAEIRKQQPSELYVCQDGPRENNENDRTKIQEVRNVINELVDWPCNLHTLYQKKNLGCGAGPATGISWFFDNVEMGIVMEDDCLPHPDFFSYCEELLNRYKDDNRIGYISSTLYDNRWQCDHSYGFSHYMITGAWASWKRCWEGFDLDLKSFDVDAFYHHLKRLTNNKQEAKWWYYAIKEIKQDSSKKSYWDFQMQIHLFKNSYITIHPQKNLISNIGFDAEGTHTLGNDGRGDKETFPILPLNHPEILAVDTCRDAHCFAKTHSHGFWKDTLTNLYQDMLWSNGLGHKLLKIYKKFKGSGYNTHRV